MFKKVPVTVSILLLVWSLPAAAQDFKVTLLGTGAPNPIIDRFGPATLVEVGGQILLFDAGRGAALRLHQMDIPLSATCHGCGLSDPLSSRPPGRSA